MDKCPNLLGYLQSCYGENMRIHCDVSQGGGPWSSFPAIEEEMNIRRLNEVTRMHTTHLVSDTGYPSTNLGGSHSHRMWWRPQSSYARPGPYRHSGGGDVLLFDGHVQWMIADDVGAGNPDAEALFDPDL